MRVLTGDAARGGVYRNSNVPPAATPNELVDQDGSDWSEGIPSGGNGRATRRCDRSERQRLGHQRDRESKSSFLKVDVDTGKVTNFRLPAPDGFARGICMALAVDCNGESPD